MKGGPTTEPMSEQTQAEFLTRMRALPVHEFRVQLTWLYWSTGMHPAASADPYRWGVQRSGEHITWKRPKTSAWVSFPIGPDIRPFVDELLHELRERAKNGWKHDPKNRALYYLRLVRELGQKIGIPELSPRMLRHTAVFRVVRRTHDINQARRLFRVSTEIAANYAYSPQDQAADAQILRDGI